MASPSSRSVMPARHERTEALARRAGERDLDRVVGQAAAAVAGRQLVAEHRADRAVDVADRQLERDRLTVLERALAQLDQRVVERPVEAVVLGLRAVPVLDRLVELGHVQDRREVEARRLPVLDRLAGVEHLGVADRLGEGAEPERGEVLAHLLGDELEEVHDELGLAGELLAQLGVLGRDPDRAGVEVADAHHDAAAHDERGRREAELLGAEQRRDDHVAAGLQLAVGLHDDAVAQPVEQQRLLRLGQAELPRRARVLDRRER